MLAAVLPLSTWSDRVHASKSWVPLPSSPPPHLFIRICIPTNLYTSPCEMQAYVAQTKHTCPGRSTVPFEYFVKRKLLFRYALCMEFRNKEAADKLAKAMNWQSGGSRL